MEMRKGKKRLDEMTELDRDIAGRAAKHLVLPMMDVYNLRRVAGILNGLAADFDMISRRHDISARLIILSVRDAVDQANTRIKEMTGKGKTKKPYRDRDN
jgi:hypothetical protein